jgi:hypothetical protein
MTGAVVRANGSANTANLKEHKRWYATEREAGKERVDIERK